MKAVVFTLGCKVNDCESASLISGLKERGYEVTDELERADLYILNTCAVTAEAEKKSRQLVARARKFNEEAKIIICGCASEKNPKVFAEKQGVCFVTGARHKGAILDYLDGRERYNSVEGEFEKLPVPTSLKTRAFIKIQDGCNNFCSYCIIPYLRGRIRSKSVEECVFEVENNPAQEVILTGINISSYSSEGRDFADLLRAMKHIDKRIRLGSIECRVITDEFLLSCRQLKNFAPQFHLSLQSGSNVVLKSMNRRYTREEYLEKCDLIYSYFPDAAITTDIIVGFPTENEQDFEDSLKIVDEAAFSQVHCFAFSPREGTAAYKMKDLSPDIKKERLSRLIEKSTKSKERYIERFIGKTLSFLPEEQEGEYTCGYTQNYIRVYVQGEVKGGLCGVKLTEKFRDGAKAILSDE